MTKWKSEVCKGSKGSPHDIKPDNFGIQGLCPVCKRWLNIRKNGKTLPRHSVQKTGD